MMRNFTRGMIIGGLIGASISVITNSDMINTHTRRRMVKSGRRMLKRSNLINDMLDILR